MKTKVLLIPRNHIVNSAPSEGRHEKRTTLFDRRKVISHGFMNDGGFKLIARRTGRVV